MKDIKNEVDNYVGCSDQCHLCRPLFTAEEQAACSDNKDIIRNAFIAGAEFMKKEMEHEQR